MKRLFLIALLLIILTIGAVSASEDLENTTDSTDINAISEEVELQDLSEGESLDLNDTRKDSNIEVYYPEELNLDYVLYERQIGEPGDVDFMIIRDTTYENIIISNVPNDITGILRIHYDDNDYISQSIFLKQGNPSNFTRRGPENFVEGNHTIHVDYAGDDNYKPFNKTINYYSGRVTSHILDGHNILVLSVDSRKT